MRDMRLAQLASTLAAAVAARHGRALALIGEPGIGKSWVAARALEGLPCRSASVSAAWPLRTVVASLPRAPRLPGWVERTLEGAAHGEQVEASALAGALAAWLREQAPFVLHLDDLHDAPREVARMAGDLAAGAKRTRGAVLLVASRHAVGEAFEQLRLEPLAEEGTRALLEEAAGGPLPAQAVEWIHGRAAGNPLFTLEYLRQLGRAGQLWSDGRRWNWRAPRADLRPARVEAVIEYLVAGAKAAGAANAPALEARAVLPAGPVDLGLWARVAALDLGALQSAAGALTRQGVLRDSDFTHALVREVALASLSPARRGELARRALGALAHDPVSAASYAADAGLADEEALALYLAAAGAAQGAALQARFRAAASGHAKSPERERLAFQAGSVLFEVDVQAGRELLAAAAAGGAGEPEHVTAYAHALAGGGDLEAVRDLAEGFAAAGADRVAVLGLLLTSYHAAGAHPEALDLWREHEALRAEPNPGWLRAAAAAALATGDMELADELLERGARAPGVSVQLRCDFLSLRSLAAYHRGENARAASIVEEAIAELRRLGAWRAISTARLNQAAFLRLLGRFQEMNDALEECLALRRQSMDGRSYAFAQAALAELRTDQGRFDEAEDLLMEALETLELYGPSRFLANTLAMTTTLYLAKGDYVTGLSFGERALQVARELGSPRVEREILFYPAAANARLGRGRRTLELADEMDALGVAAGAAPTDACRTSWVRGLGLAAVGERVAAASVLRAAMAMAEAGRMDVEAKKIALDVAAVEGDEDLAQEALRWFEDRGLGVGLVLAARGFPGASLGPRAETPAARPRLVLEVLGAMRLGERGKPEEVVGGRRKHLLALLLQARVTGDLWLSDLTLTDALYPELDERSAQRALKQLVHQVRRKYGPEVVARAPGGYALGASVTSDAEAFLAAVDRSAAGEGEGAQVGELLRWRGPALQDVPEGAAAELGRLLRQRAVALATCGAEAHPQETARLARWLQGSDPYSAELVALEVAALLRSGDGLGAGAALQRARERFREVGEELPAGLDELARRVGPAGPTG